MKTKVARWGNSLALRIPRKMASSHQLDEGSDIEIIEDQGDIRIRPVARKVSLDDLLKGITDENLHGEIDTGTVQGKESW